MENDLRTFAHSQSSLQTVEGLGEQGQPKKDFLEALHTDAKSQFLSENSILMKSTPTLSLNFRAKNSILMKYAQTLSLNFALKIQFR